MKVLAGSAVSVSLLGFGTMEDSGPGGAGNEEGRSLNGGLGPGPGVALKDEPPHKLKYSIPGILHFIQHEWARFEMERSQWEVDRAELHARIAFLQGERKGQENLKNDLVRRIKMLEYALKQERAKYHQLKYGTELNQGDMKPPVDEVAELNTDADAPFSSASNLTWKEGRQMLRQYLQEIGYTSTILDVRSNRVRSLLGLNNNEESGGGGGGGARGGVNGNEGGVKRVCESQGGHRTPAKKPSQPTTLNEAMLLDTEAAVLANFEFLGSADVDMDEDDDLADLHDLHDLADHEQLHEERLSRIARREQLLKGSGNDVDAEAEEVLNELNLLTQGGEGGGGGGGGMYPSGASSTQQDKLDKLDKLEKLGLGEADTLDSSLGLGELAQLTVNNEAETGYELPTTRETFRKTWNAKYTLRSHFDGVRALAFHPTEPVLVTGSEDHTLKLWNLHKTVPAKKSASLDVEPLYTFRGHTGPVLALAMAPAGDVVYSGSTDGAILPWRLPSPNIDPYDSFEGSVLGPPLRGHQDAVWTLAVHPTSHHLLSSSADGTVKLWAPSTNPKAPLLHTYSSEQDGTPTSVDFAQDEDDKLVAGFSSGRCVVFDVETGKVITRLEAFTDVGTGSDVGRAIYRTVCHPLLPITVTAHEDRHIRFFDTNSGELVHAMVAHLDAVTALALDPNGLYLLSGSHDCSIRLWNLENKTCVQEITAHRKKFDEAILDVAFHPARPFIASAGADGLAKVFV